jgi:hypothetical protein
MDQVIDTVNDTGFLTVPSAQNTMNNKPVIRKYKQTFDKNLSMVCDPNCKVMKLFSRSEFFYNLAFYGHYE